MCVQADTCANAQASTASSTQLKEPSDASEATQPSDASGVLHAKTDAEATTATHAESKQMDDPDGEATSAAGKVEDSDRAQILVLFLQTCCSD